MNISVSLVDYIGKIESEFGDGVGVILSLQLNKELYEMIYWFNIKNEFRIVIEDKFYKHFPDIKDIYKYEYLIDLLYYIDTTVLPKREEIFKEFLI